MEYGQGPHLPNLPSYNKLKALQSWWLVLARMGGVYCPILGAQIKGVWREGRCCKRIQSISNSGNMKSLDQPTPLTSSFYLPLTMSRLLPATCHQVEAWCQQPTTRIILVLLQEELFAPKNQQSFAGRSNGGSWCWNREGIQVTLIKSCFYC